MSATPNIETALLVAKPATPATPSPSLRVYDFDFAGTKYEMDASIAEEERRFYLKMYSTVDLVNQRKVHCTVCRVHIGTAPSAEDNIKMHPILRVTHCVKCHDFYNSGEFSKGEDGSELYCRWCGQGGEVYCCSTCPFVFCKSCIIKNLSRGVITDIEQNENWNCFKCTPKILWPLRAQHWALVNYIQTQKNGLQSMPLSEAEIRRLMKKDSSTCCRLAKAKASGLSDSMESVESNASKRSHTSSITSVKKSPKPQNPPAKRPKSSNDEVVCTPDLLSMLEPDCQISVATKPAARNPVASSNITSTPRIVTVQQNYSGPSPSNSNTSSNGNPVPISRSSLPPPLVLSSSGMRYRQPTPGPVVRRTVVPNAVRSAGPVFHTINGFRVDLNSAAQQDSYRLPNGRLIQVKRQVPLGNQPATPLTPAPASMGAQVIIRQRPAAAPPPRMAHNNPTFGSNMGIYNPQINQQQRAPQIVRVNNGSQVPAINIPNPQIPANSNGGTTIMMTPAASAKGPALVRHVFPNSPIGLARSQLQDKIFNAMEICTHLTGKVQTLTHSNAYNQARSYMDLKELYIHLSYLMTYAIGRFKQLQDKCLIDMREMGFKNDANSLENGQLAAEKQASDDEENEIEIVEPKTDTITIDSDNEEETPSTSKPATNKGLKITSVKSVFDSSDFLPSDPVTAVMDQDADLDVAAFSSSILASLLEVDISEGSGDVKTHSSVSPGGSTTKKQPRKKTTNKPNPALIILERQRMEEIKKNDAKLKMKVVVKLRRAEEDFEVARKWREYIKEHDSVKANANISDVSQIQRTENQDNIMNNEGDTFDKAATKEKSADLEAEKTETPTRNETSELDIDITKSKDAIVSKDTDCTLDIVKTEINSTIKQSEEPMDITEETEHLQKDIEDKEHVEGEKPAEVMEHLEIDEQMETPIDENVAEKIPPEDHVLKNTELQEKSDPMDQVCEADEEVNKSDSVIVESNENNFVSPSVEGTTTEVEDEKSRKTESEASTTNANDAEPLLGDIDGDDNKPNAESHTQQSPRAVSEANNDDVTSKMSPIQPDAEQQKDTESSPGKPPTCASSSEVSKVTSTPSEPLAEVDTV